MINEGEDLFLFVVKDGRVYAGEAFLFSYAVDQYIKWGGPDKPFGWRAHLESKSTIIAGTLGTWQRRFLSFVLRQLLPWALKTE